MFEEKPLLIDYHCHLDLYPDFPRQILKCGKERIATLTVTTTPMAWPRNKEIINISPYIRLALGFHPQLVAQRAGEFPLFERYFSETKYIGEVGLDASSTHYASFSEQQLIFEKILSLCKEAGGKIISVHAVRSVRDVLKLIDKYILPDRGKIVLHWFSGTKSEAEKAVKMGCYFSVNIEMLRKQNRREIVASLPPERLLTETDGPFTTTFDHPSEPIDTRIVLSALSDLLKIGEEELTNRLVSNLIAIES